jgi:histidyl-tRNA synthetase
VASDADLRVLFDPFAAGRGEDGLHAFCAALLQELGSGGCRRPRIAKGARDFGADSMRVREQAFSSIRKVFKRHGAVEIDTPVFELKEVLMGKYGEDSKLIYDLADQGGELLCLRYDLTVPFARYLAMNSVGNIKRYHIAKVYRRDQPQPAKGRFREFYQCDIDIAGNYSPMVPDAEVISVAAEILSDLPIGKFMIKLNHRRILDAVFELCGVPAEKFRPICSAVDKLDKESWENVKLEMTNEKGLDAAVADRIGEFVLNAGKPKELWEVLKSSNKFGAHEGASIAMDELKLLFDYLDAMGTLQYVSFDLSLARGLDYYTGVIYEAVLVDGTSAVGSIAAGGRYDNLVGMFSVSGQQTPCVGVSIGVERVFAIMESRAKAMKATATSTMQVYVASIGPGLVAERMKVARLLWGANIATEYSHQDNPKFKKQLDYVLEEGIPFVVVFGEEELANGTVKVKDIANHTEDLVPLVDVVTYLLDRGCTPVTNSVDSVMMEKMRNMQV